MEWFIIVSLLLLLLLLLSPLRSIYFIYPDANKNLRHIKHLLVSSPSLHLIHLLWFHDRILLFFSWKLDGKISYWREILHCESCSRFFFSLSHSHYKAKASVERIKNFSHIFLFFLCKLLIFLLFPCARLVMSLKEILKSFISAFRFFLIEWFFCCLSAIFLKES